MDELILAAIRNGEIVPYYQPIFHLASRRPVGCEALCRWVQGGVATPPCKFLPFLQPKTAEALTLHLASCIGKRISHCKGWISLNLPPSCCYSEFLLELESRFPVGTKERVVLELLEDEVLTREETADLLTSRFVTAVDDWGTGYSNLSALVSHPTRYLKIDASLTRGVFTSPIYAQVCRFALRLATELGSISIAEGVETEAQAAWLSANGCILGQGYYLGRPTPDYPEILCQLCDNRLV